MIKKRRKKLKGFTLLEVLIVLVVISILLLVGLPSLTKFTNSAKRKADDLNIAAIKEAAMLYLTENDVNNVEQELTVQNLLTKGYLDSKKLGADNNTKKLVSPITNKDYIIKVENFNTEKMSISVSNQETTNEKTKNKGTANTGTTNTGTTNTGTTN